MTASLRLLSCGEDAVLIAMPDSFPEPASSFPEPVEGPPGVLDLAAAITRAVAAAEPGFAEVLDVVPAAETVLVTVAEGIGVERLRPALLALEVEPGTGAPAQAAVVEISVRYDGPDLDDVAQRTGLSVADVISAHTGTDWRVGFGGFAPGFAYLVGGDEHLRVPRRDEPRTTVPAGAVGLAGEFSAVYPRASPGGWQLIGQTDLVMWDVDRDPPALLTPGTVVRFVEVGP
jgi:KipI family sensor histidine kinase inhibitor